MLTHVYQTSNLFSGESTLTNKMDSNRNFRRCMMPHKEAEFSSQSIMKAMEKFVEAVQEMDDTILVPSRLMDLQVGDSEDSAGLKATTRMNGKRSTERDSLSTTDLYRLYTMVNRVKNELLWGANAAKLAGMEEPPIEEITTMSSSSTTTPSGITSASSKGLIRRPSVTSLASSQSLSDTDSETGNENDSGIEGEAEKKPDSTQILEENFRRHLYGLHRSLTQMSSAAQYLTKRYQNDMGATL